jgi:hypothetical protein
MSSLTNQNTSEMNTESVSHQILNKLDDIKQKITDSEYKELTELLQKQYNKYKELTELLQKQYKNTEDYYTMTIYECRCECAYDFEKFAETAGISMLYAKVVEAPKDADEVVKMIWMLSPRIKFRSNKSLDELLIIAFNQDDAHYLFETLELEKNYTGDRKLGY